MIISGISQKNAVRLQKDGALGFLEKSDPDLEEGSGKLVVAVEEILRNLPEAAPAPTEWEIYGAVEIESSASASAVSASVHGNK